MQIALLHCCNLSRMRRMRTAGYLTCSPRISSENAKLSRYVSGSEAAPKHRNRTTTAAMRAPRNWGRSKL
jgi:hypothetical protein